MKYKRIAYTRKVLDPILLDKLKAYENPDAKLCKNSFATIDVADIKSLYKKLLNVKKVTHNIYRPTCPITTSTSIGNKSLSPYKIHMAAYLAQWGFSFSDPASVTTTVLEALANYVELHP